MASEIGPNQAKLPITIAGTPSSQIQNSGANPGIDNTQFNVLSNFLQGFYTTTIANTGSDQGGWEQKYTGDTGKTLIVFGDQSIADTTATFKGKADGIVGTGTDTDVKAGGGDNQIMVTDNANHFVTLGGGDDFFQGIGTGQLTVNAGSGNDTVNGGAGNDVLSGQNDNDWLNGWAGNDTINGGAGSDTILGGAGDDVLSGGKGADFITGGAGNDMMTGGAGKDFFVFDTAASGNDTITDFSKGDILQIVDRNGDGQVTKGSDFTTSQNGADTVITFSDGGIVTLQNVDQNKLVDDKIDGQFHI